MRFPVRKYKGKRITVSVTMPEELVEAIDAKVEQTGWTRSMVVETAVVAGLEEDEAREDEGETKPSDKPKR